MKREYPSNFVPALRDPEPRVIEIEVPRELPSAPSTILMPNAGYEDRAKVFSIATAPLAAVVGLVTALVGVIGWSVPIASLVTLLLALGGFAFVWLLAFIAHLLISPDGATFFHVVLTHGYLRREQKERHRRYASLHDKKDTHRE